MFIIRKQEKEIQERKSLLSLCHQENDLHTLKTTSRFHYIWGTILHFSLQQ